jgi:hypothetical protein
MTTGLVADLARVEVCLCIIQLSANPFRGRNIGIRLGEYLKKHPPNIELQPAEGLLLKIGFPPTHSESWADLFISAADEAMSYFSALIMSDGNEELREMPLLWALFCSEASTPRIQGRMAVFRKHSNDPLALKATRERRARVKSELLEVAAGHLRHLGVTGPE